MEGEWVRREKGRNMNKQQNPESHKNQTETPYETSIGGAVMPRCCIMNGVWRPLPAPGAAEGKGATAGNKGNAMEKQGMNGRVHAITYYTQMGQQQQ